MPDQDSDLPVRAELERLGLGTAHVLKLSRTETGLEASVRAVDGSSPSRAIGLTSGLAGLAAQVAGDLGQVGLLDFQWLDEPADPLIGVARAMPGLTLVRLPATAERMADFDRCLFDAGFIRLATSSDPWAKPGYRTYLRSDLIDDLGQLGEPTGGVVSMATLGTYGRFGNQLFQWAFLKLYGLRSNCRVQAGPWIGNQLYGAVADQPDPSLQRQTFTEFSGVERTLWYLTDPPINVDFIGFFQELPASWRLHTHLFKLLFTPISAIASPIDRWLAETVPAGATKVGIHIRRGDYLIYDHVRFPWFRPIPVEWYRALLAEIWPSLERPVLIFASDDGTLIRHFHDYNPLLVPAHLLVDPAIQYFADFHVLSRCDVLTVINSSFSRMAGLLGDAGQRRYVPNMAEGVFEPYDPWEYDNFWERFEGR